MKKALLMTKLLPNPTETEKNTSCDILVNTIFFTVRFPVHSTNSISKEKKIKKISDFLNVSKFIIKSQ